MVTWIWHLLLITNVTSLIINKSVKLKPKNKVVEYRINQSPFGFLDGANISITIDCDRSLQMVSENRPALELFICPKGIYEVTDTQRDLCTEVTTYALLSPYKLHWDYVIPSTKFSMLFLKESLIKETTDVCKLSAIFLNPGGKHLSSDQMAIPTCYMAIFIVWLTGALFWVINMVCFIKYSNKLHKTLSVIIGIKLVAICLSFIYWTELNKRGKVPLKIDLPHMLSNSIFETLLFVFLMLAAEGWCIIWQGARLWKYYFVMAGSYFMMDLCFRYVHKYFQGFAIVFASMMIYIAFRCCTLSICTVKKNLIASAQFLENHGLTYKSNVTLKKRLEKQLRMFHILQILIIGLPCVLIVVESVASFLLEYHEWVRWSLLEALCFIVVLYCSALFRLQDFEEYNNITINTPYHDVVVVISPYRNIIYISNTRDNVAALKI